MNSVAQISMEKGFFITKKAKLFTMAFGEEENNGKNDRKTYFITFCFSDKKNISLNISLIFLNYNL